MASNPDAATAGTRSTRLTPNFLGSIAEVCIVTPDIRASMRGFAALGVGPFQLYRFDSSTVRDMRYKGSPGDFELLVAFARQGEKLVVELMQPVRGESLMADYLRANGGSAGVQHVAFDCEDKEMGERVASFKQRGFEVGMEGVWVGKRGTCHFVFFDTLEAVGTVVESIDFSDDWEDPECEWVPAPPEGAP